MVSQQRTRIDELGVLSPLKSRLKNFTLGSGLPAAIKAKPMPRLLALRQLHLPGYTEADGVLRFVSIDADQFENLRDSKAETQRWRCTMNRNFQRHGFGFRCGS